MVVLATLRLKAWILVRFVAFKRVIINLIDSLAIALSSDRELIV